MDEPATQTASSSSLTLQSRTADANQNLENKAQEALNWGVKHEYQIRDFEAELAGALSNSRAVHNLLVEALDSIEANRQRVDRALVQHIPHIYHELDGSMVSLKALQERLPELRTHVRAIRAAYDSGRAKARALADELEWKHTPPQEKLVRVAFSRNAPVSPREAALTRLLLALCFALLCWQLGGALDGAYRAYRHRLVWGDKLIS